MKQVVTIERRFDIVIGEGRNGQWVKQEYLAVYGDRYPKSFVFALMGERVDKYKGLLSIGSEVEISFDIESREYNGRYFTNVSVWNVEPVSAAPAAPAAPISPVESNYTAAAPAQPNPFDEVKQAKQDVESDDLPF